MCSLFPAFPSYPLAVFGQAILEIEPPIVLSARGTPRQWQSLRLAMVGSKQPGPGSETLQSARRILVVRHFPSAAHFPPNPHVPPPPPQNYIPPPAPPHS